MTCQIYKVLSLLADLHGLVVVRFEELKVLIGLDSLSAVLAHIKHWWKRNKREVRFFFPFHIEKKTLTD